MSWIDRVIVGTALGCGFAGTLGCGNASGPSEDLEQSSSAVSTKKGIDYSFSRPSPEGLHAGGYKFAVRYLSDDAAKDISQAEAKLLILAGIDVVLNWEQSGMDASGTSSQAKAAGVSDASQAKSRAAAVGMPDKRPIYFSIDFDATSGDMTALDAYFEGVASVIGLDRTGAYGGYYTIQHLFNGHKITYGWQTYAWSDGHWDSRAQLRQTKNNITAAGDTGCCDLDEAMVADFGQWGQPYGAQFVSQSFPKAPSTLWMVAGDTVSSSITLKNIGSKTWSSKTRLATTEPRDRPSVFADTTWVSTSRPAAVAGTVAPGETYTFHFDFHAPKPGTYTEHFGVVEEGVSWFSAADQAGPPDTTIQAKIVVVQETQDGGEDAGARADARVSSDDAAPDFTTNQESLGDLNKGEGCSVLACHSEGSTGALGPLGIMLAAAAVRRRRARKTA